MAVSDSAERRISSHSHPRLAELLFAFDTRLRRRHAVVEYTDDPSCVFRIGIVRSPRALTLSDGTHLRAGERVAQLHFWSEQLPPMGRDRVTVAWGQRMYRALTISFSELARYLATRPDLGDVAAIWAEAPTAATKLQSEQLLRIMTRYGFEEVAPAENSTVEHLHRFGQNILISLMVFAQNTSALRFESFGRLRVQLYTSRRAFEARFGAARDSASAAETS